MRTTRPVSWQQGSQFLFLTLGLAFSTISSAQRDFSTVEVVAEPVRDGIYMLTGSGGNIGVSVGEDGVYIIDDQFAPLTEKIEAAIKQLSQQPVRFVINTHWHGDHTGGNENLGKSGATILAHDRVRARMQQGGRDVNLFELNPEASVPDALPVITFNDELGLHLNGESVRIYHAPNGHTDGDSIVHFPASNVLHMGDLYFSGGYPFIDRASGGSLHGVIQAVRFALSISDEQTRIIPGHGPLSSRADLRDYLEMLLAVRDAVQSQIDRGLDLKATLAAKPTAPLDQRWGQGFIKGDQITAVAWQSLSLDAKPRPIRREGRGGHGGAHAGQGGGHTHRH